MAALAALAAALFNRITKVSGLGFALDLTQTEKDDAAKAVADKVSPDSEIEKLAKDPSAAEPDKAERETGNLAKKANLVYAQVVDDAQYLAYLSNVDPEECRSTASSWGIADPDTRRLLRSGSVPRGAFDVLASRAHEEVAG